MTQQSTKTDPRRGLPSASSFERLFACPGSFQLSKLVKPEEIPSSADADAGTRIHEARANQDISDLDLDETELVKQMAEDEKRTFLQWSDDYNVDDAEIIQEKRLWLSFQGKPLCSAQIDFMALSRKKRMSLIIDRKSGRKGVQPPTRNWQLKGSLVIAAANYNLVAGRVAIVQPFARKQNPCDYGPDEIHATNGAWEQLNDLLRKVRDPDAHRVTGPQCEHCPALHICPESKSLVATFANMNGLTWASLTPAHKIQIWKDSKIAAKIIEQIGHNVKSDVRGNQIPGLTLTKDQTPRVVTSTVGAFQILSQHAKDPEDFKTIFDKEIASVSVGAIEEYIAKQFTLTKKAATAWVNDKLKDHIVTTRREGYVTEVKS